MPINGFEGAFLYYPRGGLERGRPLRSNPTASRLAGRRIVGPCVVVGAADPDGNDTPAPDELVRQLTAGRA